MQLYGIFAIMRTGSGVQWLMGTDTPEEDLADVALRDDVYFAFAIKLAGFVDAEYSSRTPVMFED